MIDMELARQLREIRTNQIRTDNTIRQMQGQFALSTSGPKTFTQSSAGQTIPNLTIESPTLHDGTWDGSKEILGELRLLYDAEDAAPTTITPADGVNKLGFNGDIEVVNGIFGAATVKIGDRTLSEAAGKLVLDGDFNLAGNTLAYTYGELLSRNSDRVTLRGPNAIYELQDNDNKHSENTYVSTFNFIDEDDVSTLGIASYRLPVVNAHNLIKSSQGYTFDLDADGGGDMNLTTDTLSLQLDETNTRFEFSGHTDLTGISLSMMENTTADKQFTFANKGLKFLYTGANSGAYDGMFELELTGNIQTDVMHIHQHTGNVVAGSKLLHLHGSDADLLELEISGQGPVMSIQDTGDSDEELLEFDTTARTLRIGAADGNDDITVNIYGVTSFGADQVNFAGGTTYKVQSDGDAYLKNIYLTGGTGLLRSIAEPLQLESDDDNIILTTGGTKNIYLRAGGTYYFQDVDAANATRVTISTAHGRIITSAFVDEGEGFKDNGTAGVDGTFPDNNGNVITVSGGIITNLDT